MARERIDGKYELERLLGRGGMGAVYEAIELASSRRVALKLLLPESLASDSDVLARFRREARASAAIDSPHVVQVLDSGVDPATKAPYMAMELLAGEDVHALFRRFGPLSPDLVLRIALQACAGLERAHHAGVIHRDIKPANTFLVRGAGRERVLKLLDFGIAKVRRDPLAAADATAHALTRTGAVLGSPLYMSPEQAVGAKTLDGRSDLFSLGVMMYELLSGHTPGGHCASLGELLVLLCSNDARPVQERAPWIPRDVAAIVHRALERDPARRYRSAGELRAALAALCPDAAIDEAMLVPLPVATRASVAPRHEVATGASPAAGTARLGPVSPMAATAGSSDAAAATDAGASPPPWLLAVERIEKQITLRSPIASVWRAISDARAFGTWFGVELEGPFAEGAPTRGRTRPTEVDPDIAKLQEAHAGLPFELTVERIDPPRLFSFRWHPFALDPAVDYSNEPTTQVVFELTELDGATRLTITESGFERLPPARRAAAFTSNDGGWTVQTRLLEKYLARAS